MHRPTLKRPVRFTVDREASCEEGTLAVVTLTEGATRRPLCLACLVAEPARKEAEAKQRERRAQDAAKRAEKRLRRKGSVVKRTETGMDAELFAAGTARRAALAQLRGGEKPWNEADARAERKRERMARQAG